MKTDPANARLSLRKS